MNGPSSPSSHLRAYSESAQVVDLAAAGDTLWVATSRGLLRWDLRAGSFERIGRGSGIPADHATAVTTDPRGGVWVATENGIARRENDKGKWQMWAAPEVGDRVSVLSAAANPPALWAGGPTGAARMPRGSKWELLLRKTAVTVVLPDRDGDGAWIGTRGNGVARVVSGKAAQLGSADGNEVREVRGIAHAEEGGVLWAGMTGGHAMLGFHDGAHIYSYRLDPDGEVRFLRRVGGQILLGMDGHVFTVRRVPEDLLPTGKLRADITNPPRGERAPRAPRWEGRPIEFAPPSELTATFATPSDLWMGTRALGALRWNGMATTHYATHDLTDGADRLTVACASADECYVATGGARAWWFDGRGFQETEVDTEAGSRVLVAVRDPRGNVIAIDRGARGRSLRLYGVNQGVWSPVAMQDIEVPEGPPDLTFAAYAPSGRLWLGLQYKDKNGEPHFFGAAEVDTVGGRVQYHRQYPKGTSPPPGTLPIPNDCTAVHFSTDGIWFATKSGAVRVDGISSRVRLWTENNGLESELLRDVTGGLSPLEVWVATDRGVGHFDGKKWLFHKDGPLGWRARALARSQDGTLWVATDHGALSINKDGAPGLVFDQHAGLLDDDARDIVVDLVGRVWVLGAHGLGVIDPPKTP